MIHALSTIVSGLLANPYFKAHEQSHSQTVEEAVEIFNLILEEVNEYVEESYQEEHGSSDDNTAEGEDAESCALGVCEV